MVDVALWAAPLSATPGGPFRLDGDMVVRLRRMSNEDGNDSNFGGSSSSDERRHGTR